MAVLKARQLQLPPLSLYIHTPWCVKKCPYCDFNSHTQEGEIPEIQYIDQLIKDFSADLSYVQGRQIQSVFIGGGTPSLLKPESFARLFSRLRQLSDFADACEITLEANPGTFEQDRFDAFRQTGINRLSLGIQSFNEKHLLALGRIHDSQEAFTAATKARESGFDNINLDLMFGLPDQTEEEAMADLKTAMACKPDHISWYQLTLEPNTVFYSKPPALPDDDALLDIQERGIRFLEESGFRRYEISAYATQGKQCLHNLNYWQFGDYIGIGAGAHGKITLLDQNRIIRTRKTRLPRSYLGADNFCVECKTVVQRDLPLEFMMNVMRMSEGSTPDIFSQRTGLPLRSIAAKLDMLKTQGLVDEKSLKPTRKGQLYLNNLLEIFLEPAKDELILKQ